MAGRGLSFYGPLFIPKSLHGGSEERPGTDDRAGNGRAHGPPLPPELYARCIIACSFLDCELRRHEAAEDEEAQTRARVQVSKEEAAAQAERQLRLLLERGSSLSTHLRSRQQKATRMKVATGRKPNRAACDRLKQKMLSDARSLDNQRALSEASAASPDASTFASQASPVSSLHDEVEFEDEDEDELSESSGEEEEEGARERRLPAALASGQEMLAAFMRSLIFEVHEGRDGARLYTASRCIQQAHRAKHARNLVQDLKDQRAAAQEAATSDYGTGSSAPDSPDPYQKAAKTIQSSWRGALARIAFLSLSKLKLEKSIGKVHDKRLASSEAGSRAAQQAASDATAVYEQLSKQFGLKKRLLPMDKNVR